MWLVETKSYHIDMMWSLERNLHIFNSSSFSADKKSLLNRKRLATGYCYDHTNRAQTIILRYFKIGTHSYCILYFISYEIHTCALYMAYPFCIWALEFSCIMERNIGKFRRVWMRLTWSFTLWNKITAWSHQTTRSMVLVGKYRAIDYGLTFIMSCSFVRAVGGGGAAAAAGEEPCLA